MDYALQPVAKSSLAAKAATAVMDAASRRDAKTLMSVQLLFGSSFGGLLVFAAPLPAALELSPSLSAL